MRGLVLAVALIACVTPYQPRGFQGGYTDFEALRRDGVSPGWVSLQQGALTARGRLYVISHVEAVASQV